jgi:hypothetical protein
MSTAPPAKALRVLQKLAVIGTLGLDLELFLGPRTEALAVFQTGEQVTSHVYMFRTQDPECAYMGPNTNYHTFWLPQWDCTPTETARYALFVGVILCGLFLVMAPRRMHTSGAARALFAAQTTATAATLLECCVANVAGMAIWLAWIPLLLCVAIRRTPRAWRGRMVRIAAGVVAVSGAYVVARLNVQPAVNPPHWRVGSQATSAMIGTYWFAQQLMVLPLLAAVVGLAARPSASARVGRVITSVTFVALSAAGVAFVAQLLSARRTSRT